MNNEEELKDQNKDQMLFQHCALVYKEMRKEINAKQKNLSVILIEVLVATFAVVEVAFVHGPVSILLIIPGVVFYFFYLAWEQMFMIDVVAKYLKNNIEPALKGITGIKGWETYYSPRKGENRYKLLSVSFIFFPLLALIGIMYYFETVPIGAIFYVKPFLLIIGSLYGIIMVAFGSILFLLRRREVE